MAKFFKQWWHQQRIAASRQPETAPPPGGETGEGAKPPRDNADEQPAAPASPAPTPDRVQDDEPGKLS